MRSNKGTVRATDWVNYEERFDAVAVHISEHLSDPLDLIRLAEVAGLSPRHWHRVFTAAFGEPLAAYIKRKRLQHASFLLANTRESVAAIAVSCGYPNVSSFTRAFGAAYELPPARYRIAGSHVAFDRARAAFDPLAFDVQIRDVAPLDCLAVAHRGSYIQIDEAFRDLEIWYAAHGHGSKAQQLFGIYSSDPTQTPEAELRSLACCPRPAGLVGSPVPVSAGAAEIVEITIAGGSYAVLSHSGPYADMPAKYDWLFGCWLIASGYQLSEQPVVEQYVTLPHNTPPSDLRTEMWLPLMSDPTADGAAQ